MNTRRIINQSITLLLASMLLVVAGVKTWSMHQDSANQYNVTHKSLNHSDHNDNTKDNQATVTSLSLDAVITPAITFDFCQYFYFLPSTVWQFICQESVVSFFFQEPFFFISGFARIFGTYIVTNAP